MKFFVGDYKNREELKKEYKKLALLHHPDNNGDVINMQMINAEYEFLFDRFETTQDDQEQALDFINVINVLIKYDDITIEICGSWLWVTGVTKPIKEELKALHFRWASKKCAWYLAGTPCKSRRNSTLDEIRNKYGSQVIKKSKLVLS